MKNNLYKTHTNSFLFVTVLGGSRIASVGDEIVVSVKKARPLILSSDVASKASAGNLLWKILIDIYGWIHDRFGYLYTNMKNMISLSIHRRCIKVEKRRCCQSTGCEGKLVYIVHILSLHHHQSIQSNSATKKSGEKMVHM